MGNLLFHNYFLEKGISINDIPLEHKEILKELINKVQILNYTYICKYCNEIPKIDITYNPNGNIKKIIFKECGNSITLDDKVMEGNEGGGNLFCKKITLEKLHDKNYENEPKGKRNFLFFENLDDFYEYLDVFKSYLKVREQIKNIIFDTKRNELFSFFEDLLFIGFYGYGTRYEYENSIVIKNFSIEKFNKFNMVEKLSNNKQLVKIRKIHSLFLYRRLGDTNLIMFLYYSPPHILFLKAETFLDLSFDINEYNKYYRTNVNEIPLKFRKNFINILPYTKGNNNNNIHLLGENKYLIRDTNFDIWIYIYNEKENIYNRYPFEKNAGFIICMHVFQKDKIVFITDNYIYIYKFDPIENKLSYVQKFSIPFHYDRDRSVNFVDLKNGDLIFNISVVIYHICGSTYEIKNIYKLYSDHHTKNSNFLYLSNFLAFVKINEKIIKFIYELDKESKKEIFININTKKEIKDRKLKKAFINKSEMNKLFKLGKKYFIYRNKIIDTKTSNVIYEIENCSDLFILDEKESIFGTLDYNTFLVFQIN